MVNRVLIVGFGSIGKRHLEIVRSSLPHATIYILRHQENFQTPDMADGIIITIEEALAFSPDIAIIANPAPFHLFYAKVLAAHGAHILVEKPISNNPVGVDELIEICRRNHRILLVGYNLRYSEGLAFFKSALEKGIIGDVLSVRCEVGQYLPSWRPDTDYRLGVSAQQKLGGGVLLELSHELDYLRWIFGEVTWVNAWLGRQSSLDIDVEDTAHLTIEFKQKDKYHHLVASVNLDFIRHDVTRVCTAIGVLGSLRWNAVTGYVDKYMAGDNTWCQIFHDESTRDESYRIQWQHFLDCIETGCLPQVTGEDSLAVMNMISAARHSALEQNRKVLVVFR